MVRASSINTGLMITIGLCVANAMTGLSGGLLAQYQKSCDINLGTGMVTIALASLIIGESIIGKGGVLKRVIGVVLGSCLYRFIVAIALRLNVPGRMFKTGIITHCCICDRTALSEKAGSVYETAPPCKGRKPVIYGTDPETEPEEGGTVMLIMKMSARPQSGNCQ